MLAFCFSSCVPAPRPKPTTVVMAPSASQTALAPSTSEFHVAAEGMDGDSDRSPELELAQIQGAAFLFSPFLSYRDGAFVSAGMGDEALAPNGRWPDDIWALQNPECQRAGRIETPECPFGLELVLWRRDHWEKHAFLQQDISEGFDFRASAWPKQRALSYKLRHAVDNDGKEHPVYVVSMHGKAPLPPLTATLVGKDVRHAEYATIIGPDEALLFGWNADGTQFVEHWLENEKRETFQLPTGAKLWASDWPHLVTSNPDGETKAFDGTSWTRVELPEGSSVVHSWARETSGRQWLVVGDGRKTSRGLPLATRVFRRTRDTVWTRVELPRPAFPNASDDLDIKVVEVRIPKDGDVWLEGWTRGDCHGRGVLLHNRPAKQVCFVERGERACKNGPRRQHGSRDAACATTLEAE